MHDYLVIGSGAAGLQLGYFLAKGGYRYLILGGAGPDQIRIHPELIGAADDLRWDAYSLLSDAPQLRFAAFYDSTTGPGDAYGRYLAAFAGVFSLALAPPAPLRRIDRAADGRFQISDTAGASYAAGALFLTELPGPELFAPALRPALAADGLPEQTATWQSPAVPNLFFAGALMRQGPLQQATAGLPCGYRYLIRALYHLRHTQANPSAWWPSGPITATATSLTDATLRRVNHADGLWHQAGVLGDLIVRERGQKAARYYREVPLAAVPQRFDQQDECYVITLEAAPLEGAAVERPLTAERSAITTFVRPVVRRYTRGALQAQHGMLTTIGHQWDDPDTHVPALRRFFERQMA